jgi:hypothetical protein
MIQGREPDFWTGIVGIAAITLIVSVGALCGYDHTLIKLGIAAIAAIAGFSLRGLIRWL